jgi:hypothetical protein
VIVLVIEQVDVVLDPRRTPILVVLEAVPVVHVDVAGGGAHDASLAASSRASSRHEKHIQA